MRVLMDLHRQGQQYQGWLTRLTDELCVEFAGVLELVAALERLDPEESGPQPPDGASTER